MSNSSTVDPLIGRALDGRYQIISRLARGGMATVYRTEDRRLDRTVAVKVMHEGLGDDQDFARNFDREARAAARLSHPSIVSVFDQGNDFGRPYIVMELVEGSTLRRLVSRDAPLSPSRSLDLIDPILSALAAAHDSGLIHRDVKPENVLISRRGQLKVADFGLARAVTAQSAAATQGLLVGTVSYLPPELVELGHADTRSDVYSAGIMLFEMLTGKKPHTGDTPIQVAYAHVHRDVPKPSDWVDTDWRRSLDGIPPYLDALVGAATARDPEQRPRDARAFLDGVRRARKALSSGIMHDPHLTALLADPNSLDDTEPVDIEYTPTRRAMAALAASRAAATAARETSRPTAPGEGMTAISVATAPATPTVETAHVEGPVLQGPVAEAPVTGNRVAENRAGAHCAVERPRVPVTAAPTVPDAVPSRPEPVTSCRTEAPAIEAEEIDWADSGAIDIDRESRRRRVRRVASVITTLVAVLALALGVWWLTAGRYLPAPTVTNMTQPDAAAAVKAAGLNFATTEEFSETVPSGRVVATVPGPGEDIARGATLTAVLSKGPERYPVPPVIGKDGAAAQEALKSAHLAVGTLSQAWSEDVAEGVVLAASVQPGTTVRPGTAVDLTVSKGKEPIAITTWYNRDAKDAVATLAGKGLRVVTSEAFSDQVAAGKVAGQTPADGTLHRGDTVTLTISKGPAQVSVPDVKGMAVKDAQDTMTKAGFKTSTQPVEVNYLGLGYVARASSDPGSMLAKGSTITLYLV
ncbi:PASTA domain-containing protein [Raineyella fluvialis]|uniref:non-specific serine/threonine protein kinase n=1 Tax=Raineyella fluvialis TaxID=2662261 RepID=A0A5Q2FHS8_9ACTN|nr:PASTA domain-containing protein [Raineyella fluvialis]QGF24215.1 PASTA domain-containing protein [Raineyella fluvialis]